MNVAMTTGIDRPRDTFFSLKVPLHSPPSSQSPLASVPVILPLPLAASCPPDTKNAMALPFSAIREEDNARRSPPQAPD